MSQDIDIRRTLIEVTKTLNVVAGRVAALTLYTASLPGADQIDIKRFESDIEKITPKTIHEPTGMSNALGEARLGLQILAGHAKRLAKPEVR